MNATQTNPTKLADPESKPEQTLAEILLAKVHKLHWYKNPHTQTYMSHPKRYTLSVDKLDFVMFLDEMDEPLETLTVVGMWKAIERTLDTKQEIKVQSVKQLAESL